MTTLEAKLKHVPVVFVFVDSLTNETTEPENYQKKYVQVSKKSSYVDLKKRIADVAS